MNEAEITSKLKALLKESRFNHSISVAQTARELALRFGACPDKAYLAGLVHDCAKCFTPEELYKKIGFYGIDLSPDTLSAEPLLHSFVGAFEAKYVYGIDDEEILDAIYYHTIGKADMAPLTAIIYIADAIEPLRSYPGVERIRLEAESSLEKAIYTYTCKTIDYVKRNGNFLHPNAEEVREFYKQKIKQRRLP